jgi:hypothetical protein
MGKAIAMISMDPVLKQEADEVLRLMEQKKERFKFLEKQLEDIHTKTHELQKPHWERIEARLKELNLLPENYDPKEHGLALEHENNLITMHKQGEATSFSSFIQGLLKS